MKEPTPPPLPEKTSSPKPGDDPGMRILMPVGRSGYAIAAGYLALFSVLIFPAPLALIFGILGLRDIGRSKGSDHPKHGKGRAIFGIIMGALGTIAILAVLIGILSGR